MSETDLVIAILEALALEPGVIAWRNAQITARRSGRPVRGGLGAGSADIIACVGPMGSFLAIEAKSPKGKARPAQITWRADLEAHGGIYVVVRSVREALEAVRLVRDGGRGVGACTRHVTPCPWCEAFLAACASRAGAQP